MLFEMLGKIDSTFQPQVTEEYNLPSRDEDPYGLIVKAVRNGFITPDEYFKDTHNFISAAQETADSWSDVEEIGSSDMTFMLKEFLGNAGIQTDFVNGKLTRTNHPLRERKNYSTYGQSNDPRIITLRRDAVCAETGKPIKAGEQAVYYPLSKDIFCMDSNQAQEFRNWKADMDAGYDY